jgi:hypothetical protein
LEIWHSRVEFAREIKRIEHRGLRSELQGILVRARDNLVQDDNFPPLVKRQQARIEDRPPLIYHFTAKGDTSMLGALLTLIKAAGRATGEDGLAITIAPAHIAAPKHSIISVFS